jgi:hypothetical protein
MLGTLGQQQGQVLRWPRPAQPATPATPAAAARTPAARAHQAERLEGRGQHADEDAVERQPDHEYLARQRRDLHEPRRLCHPQQRDRDRAMVRQQAVDGGEVVVGEHLLV